MGERQRIQACGVVTEDGDFFHAQLAGGRPGTRRGCTRPTTPTTVRTGAAACNLASTRAPGRWRGLGRGADDRVGRRVRAGRGARVPTAAASGHGKTCAELGHDPVLFEKLKAAVKKWPDKGGGDAIPGRPAASRRSRAWRFCIGGIGTVYSTTPHIVTWITAKQIVAWLGLGLIYVVGVAASAAPRSRRVLDTRTSQRLRNWVNRRIEDGGGARYCYFICCGGWLLELVARLVALLVAGLGPVGCSFSRARRARATRSSASGAPWFRRYVAPCLDKLSAGVASLRKKRAVAARFWQARPSPRRSRGRA